MCVQRGKEAQHQTLKLFGLKHENHRKAKDLFPLWASVHVSVHLCLWSLAAVCQTGSDGLLEWKQLECLHGQLL